MNEIALHMLARSVPLFLKFLFSLCLTTITLLATVAPSYAGQLVIENTGNDPISCTVDGYTVKTGAKREFSFTVRPSTRILVASNSSLVNPGIKWAICGQLEVRDLSVTPTSKDHLLVFNGQQTRVLRVSLYPYLPNVPSGNFSTLIAYVVQSYQSQNPQVLLNAVMDEDVNIYSFSALPGLLGAGGYDVMELDMLYLGFLVSNGLINPQTNLSNAPLPVAQNASSINGVLYGIPSWLCMDFLYSTNPAVQGITSLPMLQAFLTQTPTNEIALVGDFDGKWRLPSMYVNAYVQTYGYVNIQNALNMPPDSLVLSNLGTLVNNCAYGGSDFCIDGTYHNEAPGITEQVFAGGAAYTDVGFSEQSFYVALYGGPTQLYVAPVPWGRASQPLLFADSFVTNSTTCQTGSLCSGDAANFINLMTSMQMKNYIVTSQDQSPGTPWRTLLVPYDQFYTQPSIANNSLYQQFQGVFSTAQPFPNSWTAQMQTEMGAQICSIFKGWFANYSCTPAQAAKKVNAKKAGPASPPKAKHREQVSAH